VKITKEEVPIEKVRNFGGESFLKASYVLGGKHQRKKYWSNLNSMKKDDLLHRDWDGMRVYLAEGKRSVVKGQNLLEPALGGAPRS